MTLLERMMEPCVRLYREEEPDGLGGRVGAWREGEGFDAALIKPRDSIRVEGQKQEAAERWTLAAPAGVSLAFHEAFRRRSDGRVFRVTVATRDAPVPDGSLLRLALGACEGWALP